MGLQFTALALLARYYQPIPWSWRWSWQFLQPALRYGLAFSGSNFIIALKSLTVPLFVSRIAGLEAAGLISLVVRIVDQLGVLRLVVNRLSISGLAKLNGEPDLTRRAISRGMAYQALLIGPIYAVFSCCAVLVIPIVFGKGWLPSTQIFPFIALAMLISSMLVLHSSALYVAGHNRNVAKFHMWYVALLWLSSSLLLPTIGLWGYAGAEMVALLSYVSIHRSLVRLCGSPDYRDGFWLLAATTPALLIGPWVNPAFGLATLVISYGLLFSFRQSLRCLLMELYWTWRSRKSVLAP
jgi:PST family polysaccharide transporter